jgi:hypothetical protein
MSLFVALESLVVFFPDGFNVFEVQFSVLRVWREIPAEDEPFLMVWQLFRLKLHFLWFFGVEAGQARLLDGEDPGQRAEKALATYCR